MIEVFVVINDGIHLYYLLKVQRRDFDVYCIPPKLGAHFSLHKTGESHIRVEEKTAKTGIEPPLVLQSGEAGKPIEGGIISASLCGLGRSSGICITHFPIDSLGEDFQEFNRSTRKCFVIDKGLFPNEVNGVEVGVWAVPARNKISFESTNPNISSDFLYKAISCEPQIWIYAQPSVLFAQ